MKILMLVAFTSFNIFSQDILHCFDARDIVDGGYSFTLKETAQGISFEYSEMTFAGPMTVASIESTNVLRTDYRLLKDPVNACSLSVYGKSETDFGEIQARVNMFEDGFVGVSVKEFVYEYMHCSYLQSKNPDAICTPGGSDKLILVDEYVQTTKDFSYMFRNSSTKYSVVTCKKQSNFNFLNQHLDCLNKTKITTKIDL